MTEMADADAAAARASEQARLRKERREAKIKAGGSARLNKITGLNGGSFQRDPIPIPQPTPTPSSAPTTAAAAAAAARPNPDHADPDEVDISRHDFPSRPQPPPMAMSEAQLRQLMLGGDIPRDGGPTPFAANPALGGGGGQDAMLQMLQQMMGGGGGDGSTPQQQQSPPVDTYAATWRLLHLAVALGLGLYVAVWGGATTAGGTLAARSAAAQTGGPGADGESEAARRRFLYLFASAEAALLTSRFFLDRARARAPPAGLAWTVAGLLPPRARARVETALRYADVLATVRADLLACVFVLGVCYWWRGMTDAAI